MVECNIYICYIIYIYIYILTLKLDNINYASSAIWKCPLAWKIRYKFCWFDVWKLRTMLNAKLSSPLLFFLFVNLFVPLSVSLCVCVCVLWLYGFRKYQRGVTGPVVSSRFGYDVDVTSRYTLIALGVVSQLTSFPAGLISEL